MQAPRAGLRASCGGSSSAHSRSTRASPRRTSISRARAITRATSTARTPRCARARASRAKRSGSSTAAWSISGAAMRRPRCRRSSARSTSMRPPSRPARIRSRSSRSPPTTSASRCAQRARRSARASGCTGSPTAGRAPTGRVRRTARSGRAPGPRAWLSRSARRRVRRQRRAVGPRHAVARRTSATRTTCVGVWARARRASTSGAGARRPRACSAATAGGPKRSRRPARVRLALPDGVAVAQPRAARATPLRLPLRLRLRVGRHRSVPGLERRAAVPDSRWSARSSTELLRPCVRRRLPLLGPRRSRWARRSRRCLPAAVPRPTRSAVRRFVNERGARDRDGYGSGAGISHAETLPLRSLLSIPDPSLARRLRVHELRSRRPRIRPRRAPLLPRPRLRAALGPRSRPRGQLHVARFRHPTHLPGPGGPPARECLGDRSRASTS